MKLLEMTGQWVIVGLMALMLWLLTMPLAHAQDSTWWGLAKWYCRWPQTDDQSSGVGLRPSTGKTLSADRFGYYCLSKPKGEVRATPKPPVKLHTRHKRH